MPEWLCHGIAVGAEVELFAFGVSHCSATDPLVLLQVQHSQMQS